MSHPDPPVFGDADTVTFGELRLAARNHGMPLEVLRHDRTPVGLHYLLTHYDIPDVDPDTWRLVIDGSVRRPRHLSLRELRALPAVTVDVTMECAGNGRALMEPRPISQPWLHEAVGTASWTGAPLAAVLDEAGLDDGCVDLVFTGLDTGIEGGVAQAYARSLPRTEVARGELLLAYEMNGAPLLPQHGAPVRLVNPGWYGMTNVKWLAQITAATEPFTGYQQTVSYRFRTHPDDAGTPLTRIMPRALMVPPGAPEFATRRRFLPTGEHRLTGRAWSGWAPVDGVDVSLDGGESWTAAVVDPPAQGRWAWQSWHFDWHALESGDVVLCCRARDAMGNDQGTPVPGVTGWNLGGYVNPAPQRVVVTVQD
jgi:sulfane dehydrogenase subunit SoxC